MASVKKMTDSGVGPQIKHVSRESENNSNKDINKAYSHLNYSLTPERPIIYDEEAKCHRRMTHYEYYKKRKNELYCYHRADVKTMAGWVITAPHDLPKDKEQSFFASSYRFLRDLYGEENIIACYVHYDEGKRKRIVSWNGPVLDENGREKTRLVCGRPHMHFCFIPVVPDKRHKQGYKICANDLLNRAHLQRFHADLEKHLRADGIYCSVRSGITKTNGRNYTVAEMKAKYEKTGELMYSRNLSRDYSLDMYLD